ncbi:MAG TPA: hypothetical protein VIC02_00325 [Kineobactrum sp.]
MALTPMKAPSRSLGARKLVFLELSGTRYDPLARGGPMTIPALTTAAIVSGFI